MSKSPRVADARPFIRQRPGRERRLGTLAGLAGLAVLILLLALLINALESASPTGAQTPPSVRTVSGPNVPTVQEGPGGRVRLGTWRLRRDPRDLGLGLGWRAGHWYGQLVHVPFDANPAPITGHPGVINFDGSVAWYRTSFTTTQAGLYALDFDSVNFKATVWVDGRQLGTHVGTYLPFELRFGATTGRHTLVVRVDWRDPDQQSADGFHRTWFNFGGINGEVTVRPVGLSDLEAPSIHTYLDNGRATVDVAVEVHNYGPQRPITVGGVLQNGSTTIPLPFQAVTVPRGSAVLASAQVVIDNPALWSPSHPNLYDLRLEVGRESSYYAPVGLRQLTWSGDRMFLNGQRLILHGASIQEDARGRGDALTPVEQDDLIAELKQIGANATRSQHPLDPALLERLDRAGIVVWQGVGPVDPAGDWTARTPALMRAAEGFVRTTVDQDELHPSIIAWNLANEVAGNGHSGGQVQYVESMADYLHTRDPGRMVALDVWGEHPPTVPGPMYDNVDAIGETNYSGWYDGPLGPASAVEAYIRGFLQSMHRAFPDKVQVISEFGAEANTLNPTARPGGYAFQSRLLTDHIDVYEHDPHVSGMLVWDLRDFAVTPLFAGGSINRRIPGIQLVKGVDQKGLWTYENAPKPAERVVAALYDALGGSATP